MTRPRPDLPGAPFTTTDGTRAWEPHPWGGVPGIFKQLTVQAGLDAALPAGRGANANLPQFGAYADKIQATRFDCSASRRTSLPLRAHH